MMKYVVTSVVIVGLVILALWFGGRQNPEQASQGKSQNRPAAKNVGTTSGKKQETIDNAAVTKKEAQVNRVFHETDQVVRKLGR